jgi:low temperature requirement protein LtrA
MVLRDGERVSPLELFFDLVFVLALTQCTALMAHDPTWHGMAEALVLLAMLWWAWVGYSWLTSVIDPDEGSVRLILFAAMAALLVTSLCIPDAYGDLGLTFAVAYGVVRMAHVSVFALASRDDEGLHHSVLGFTISTGIAMGTILVGALFDGDVRFAVWVGALVLDLAGALVVDTNGWRFVPGHFAERHGLIVIVALGESIVAIGVGAEAGVDGGVIAAAVLGIAVAGAFWWTYFDVASLAAAQRLASIESVKVRNELARDAYSYLHLPMVAAVVLVAFGMKSTLAHVGDPLDWETSVALIGGAALYLLSHVAFKYRSLGAMSRFRLVAALVLLAAIPVGREVDALTSVALVAAVLWVMLAVESIRYAEMRSEIRRLDHDLHNGDHNHHDGSGTA